MGETLWTAPLDLEKAFDKVIHDTVFVSLLGNCVEIEVVAALQLGWENQSRLFPSLRDVRQGDHV